MHACAYAPTDQRAREKRDLQKTAVEVVHW